MFLFLLFSCSTLFVPEDSLFDRWRTEEEEESRRDRTQTGVFVGEREKVERARESGDERNSQGETIQPTNTREQDFEHEDVDIFVLIRQPQGAEKDNEECGVKARELGQGRSRPLNCCCFFFSTLLSHVSDWFEQEDKESKEEMRGMEGRMGNTKEEIAMEARVRERKMLLKVKE